MKKIITFLMIMLCFNSLATGGTSLDGIQLKDLNNKTVTLGKYKKSLYKNVGFMVSYMSCRIT